MITTKYSKVIVFQKKNPEFDNDNNPLTNIIENQYHACYFIKSTWHILKVRSI